MIFSISNSKIKKRSIEFTEKFTTNLINTTTMCGYEEVQKTCLTCKKEIRDNQSIIYCEVGQCFWHKKCLKNKIKEDYDDKLDAGYNYSASDSYKKKRCGCGCFLKKKDRPSRITKKALKKVAIPILLIIIAL
jgi:hypothetical protein